MTTTYVLIDYENVQPKDAALLAAQPFRVLIFVGASQKTLGIDLVQSLQPLGERVEYVRVSGNGRNALDFHIAFYVGELAAGDPSGVFCIVSKDTGFDPLLAHLKSRGVRAVRAETLGGLPGAEAVSREPADERLAAVIEDLRRRGSARPRRRKTLASTIGALLGKQHAPQEVERLIAALASHGVTVAQDGTVRYAL